MNTKGRKILPFGAALALCAGIAMAGGENPKQLWEAAGFVNPESVVYDPGQDVLYVSNVNGDPGAKDGNGFVSKVGMDGTVIAHDWVTGLNAPKGTAVVGNHLYIADIDTVIEIDTKTGAIANRYQDAAAKFFNDIAAAADGTIYISDSNLNRIYRLKDGKLEVWLEDKQLDAPNGLLVEKDRILVGTMGDFQTKRPGQFLAVSLADKKISNAGGGKTVGMIDGVEASADGNYYLTDWPAGKVLRMTRDGRVGTLMEIKMGTADFDVIQSKDEIVIPLMMDGKLVAYKLHEDKK